MPRTKRQYRAAHKYSPAELDRARIADLLTDARAALRFAREIENGANPAHYGCTVAQYYASAESARAEYRAWRAAGREEVAA